jgi:hypothetical protein
MGRFSTEETHGNRPSKLRALASWQHNVAQQAGNPAIWEARLRTAEKLEAEADLVERIQRRRNQEHIGEANGTPA